jgi:hypothetical protein
MAAMALPFIFPKWFFRPESVCKCKILFYNIIRDSENPFIDEKTSISIYDPDKQLYYAIEDVYDDESYEEICEILKTLATKHDYIYMITYDIENKELCFKLCLQTLLEDMGKFKFIDIKKLFYSIHPSVPKITYNDILEYYKLPKLESKSLEYCLMFDNIAKDQNIDFQKDEGKVMTLFKQVNPV